ncbi:MAG: hypothetical protein ACTHM9_05285 [Gemmatimonadales bacterium]
MAPLLSTPSFAAQVPASGVSGVPGASYVPLPYVPQNTRTVAAFADTVQNPVLPTGNVVLPENAPLVAV